MATFQPDERGSFKAAADLSAKNYHALKLNTNGDVVLATAGTDPIIGVLDGETKLGHTADVVFINGAGSFKVKAGAAIAAGALITADASGKAVTATTGDRAFGRALYAAVDGEIFECMKVNEKA